ncbi:hypothetical protein ACA910_002598 [Epithemia clementina (nom. ined.)]
MIGAESKSVLKKDAWTPEIVERKQRSKKVAWGHLVIYEFVSILGDNPTAVDGCPLTISWKHRAREDIEIDFYEYIRKRQPRRTRKEMILPGGYRNAYLLSKGYSFKQLLKVSQELEIIRKSRLSNMGRGFESFKNVFSLSIPRQQPMSSGVAPILKARVVCARSG